MAASELAHTTRSPSADILPSFNTCEISLIDTTTDLVVKTSALIEPEIQGHEFLNLPTFAFYIYNPRLDKRVLFDMGSRKDWWNLPPEVVGAIEMKGVPAIRITKSFDEILSAGGVDPKTIDAVVWSHYHWDHVGNIQLFPSSTDVVVGSGFNDTFPPGYPTNLSSPFYENDFSNRSIHEISFDGNESLQIGQLQAYDYFEDHSFYILKTPGHTAGRISGLVRTTDDTFVFLGGDISHFGGTFRPTQHTLINTRIPQPCPCSLFTACHPGGASNARTTPFYNPSTYLASWYDEATEAKRSIEAMEEFDADDNVFMAIAHDPGLREVMKQFPHATMNNWKPKQWKTLLHWHFLNELPIDGKPGRPKLVDGRLKDGQRVG
ncbi:beta-lactamase-like protein [Ilyonectria destructans]|nr:beta-lactamase-like protein [Ilyonectria destructans]